MSSNDSSHNGTSSSSSHLNTEGRASACSKLKEYGFPSVAEWYNQAPAENSDDGGLDLNGSENDTGRHMSELTAFSYQAPIERTSMPACTLFPETLCHEADPRPGHLLPLKKTTVASPRVLIASIRRRRPSKQGAKLYSCPRLYDL